MTEKILFFFSALGVFNAAILSLYLAFVKAKRQMADYFLAILVFLLVIRVGVSCFQFFGSIPFAMIKWGLIANLLLGPAIWLSMKSLTKPDNALIKNALIQLGLWAIALSIAWFVFDTYTWDWRLRFVIHGVLTLYLLVTAYQYRLQLKGFFVGTQAAKEVKMAARVFISLLLICAGFAVSLFTNYILGPMIFSLIFYLAIGYHLLSQQKEQKQGAVRKIDDSVFEKLNKKLVDLMESEKLYRNPELSLELLANKLSVSRHLLSQLLNDNLNKNFHQYINDYRIQEACHLLVAQRHYSIEAVGAEVGFHSRSSFFTSFKRLKGMTPSSYRKQA